MFWMVKIDEVRQSLFDVLVVQRQPAPNRDAVAPCFISSWGNRFSLTPQSDYLRVQKVAGYLRDGE